jgi:hypothetical protein
MGVKTFIAFGYKKLPAYHVFAIVLISQDRVASPQAAIRSRLPCSLAVSQQKLPCTIIGHCPTHVFSEEVLLIVIFHSLLSKYGEYRQLFY